MSRSRPLRAGFISDSELLQRAYAMAVEAHGDQRRATDQTRFIEHVVEVGELLHGAGFDERLVAAGLLHDAVERGQLSEADLRAEMDDEIWSLVMALTEDATIESFGRRKEALREQVRAGGTRAVTIFAADKLSDIRGLARGVVRSADSTDSIPRPTSPSASASVFPMSAVTSAVISWRCRSSASRRASTQRARS